MSEELAAQLALRFIQNRDTKAIQFSNGDYVPDFKMKDTMPEFGGSPETSRHGLGFKMNHLLSHLAGDNTYGHYILDNNSKARMFAFDIDLEKEGYYCQYPDWKVTGPGITNNEFDSDTKVYGPVNPRELWLSREQVVARDWYKRQMMTLVHKFTSAIQDSVGVPTAAAYSGNKGVHVYGFTGQADASEVREAADIVMKVLDEFEPKRGRHFFQHKNPNPVTGYSNFSVEVFPKQTDVDKGALGNLMRLPLGRNQKTTDPTFFLDLKAPPAVMRPHPNPIELLKSGNPYA